MIDILIPAAGCNYRVKNQYPKCLLKVRGNKTVIDCQIEEIKRVYPLSKINVVVGFCGNTVKEKLKEDINVLVNEEYMTTNVSYSIFLYVKQTNNINDVIIIYSDILFNGAILKQITGDYSRVLIGKNFKNHVSVLSDGSFINRFSYNKIFPSVCGIFFLKRKDILDFVDIVSSNNKYKKYYIHEIFNIMIENGTVIRSFIPKSSIYEVTKNNTRIKLT